MFTPSISPNSRAEPAAPVKDADLRVLRRENAALRPRRTRARLPCAAPAVLGHGSPARCLPYAATYGYPWEAVPLLTLDLHPIFRNNRDLDVALRQALFRAAATGVDVLQVIPGKGTGALRQRVLTTLAQTHLKKLYARVEVDPDNPGRILVHLR